MKITYTVDGKRVFGNGRKITDAVVFNGVVMGHTTGGRPFIIAARHLDRMTVKG